jgi:hypothetical protein
MSDSFGPTQFQLSLEELKTAHQQESAPTRRKTKQPIEFYPFPGAVLYGILSAKYSPALALAMAVYKTWYEDFEKRNPVRLTSKTLEDFGLSRFQKSRGLKVLENTGQFVVERFPGNNPLVTMKWKLIKD